MMPRRSSLPYSRAFGPVRLFISRYQKSNITYANGKPFIGTTSRYGGMLASSKVLVVISAGDLELQLDNLLKPPCAS